MEYIKVKYLFLLFELLTIISGDAELLIKSCCSFVASDDFDPLPDHVFFLDIVC